MATTNPFLSTQKASDPVPAILHPLVLLSISDHITRHKLRRQPGPVVGALLGQQNGRQVTLEHTFDFLVAANNDGDAQFSPTWFQDRLEQMRTVHRDRQLDLVGWYTVLNRAGPTPHILQVHEQILPLCSDSTAAVLLAFHPEDLASPSVGGKLPLTIYETTYEPDENGAVAAARRRPAPATAEAAADSGADKEMTDVGDETAAAATTSQRGGAASQMAIKFREMSYAVETGDAEMISIDFVAGGVANASAADSSSGTAAAAAGSSSSSNSRDRAVPIDSGNRSKRRLVAAGVSAQRRRSNGYNADGSLSREDEELIATLTTRGNAIRMLHARLQLLTKYLESLEAAEQAAEDGGDSGGNHGGDAGVKVSLPILRSIQALVQRLPLVVPPPVDGDFEEERQREANDVELVSLLLDDLMQNIAAVRQVSSKFGVIDSARSSRGTRPYGRGVGGGGSGDGTQGLDMLL